MEKENKKKSKKLLIIYAITTALIAGAIALVIFVLTNKKEVHTYVNRSDGKTMSLVCNIQNNDNAFFTSETSIEMDHAIKFVDKISYEFDGVYDTADKEKEEFGAMHTNYNIYMGDHGVDHEILTPVFQYEGEKARIRLYLDDYRKMNSVIGKVFYIGSGIQDTVAKGSAEDTKKIFENKGFSCIISD